MSLMVAMMLQLLLHLLHVLLGPVVRRLHHGAHHFGIAADHQRLIRSIGVDAYAALEHRSVLHCPTLPQGVAVHLKLTRVRRLRAETQMTRQYGLHIHFYAPGRSSRQLH